MSSAPYFVPDNDSTLNSALVLIIVSRLGKTARARLLLNNERLHLMFYLLKNPIVMNRVLQDFGYSAAVLDEYDEYSVSGISINLDPLYDNDQLKSLLMRLASAKFIDGQYRKVEGFMYLLTDEGSRAESALTGDYFDTARRYVSALSSLCSVSTGNLNTAVEQAIEKI